MVTGSTGFRTRHLEPPSKEPRIHILLNVKINAEHRRDALVCQLYLVLIFNSALIPGKYFVLIFLVIPVPDASNKVLPVVQSWAFLS